MAPAMAERMRPPWRPPISLGVLDTEPAMQQGRRLAARMSATIEWLARDECHALEEAGLAAELGRGAARSLGSLLAHASSRDPRPPHRLGARRASAGLSPAP